MPKATMAKHLRLGVNIDHVATLRNARGGTNPDVLRAAEMAVAGGADGITVHLREDRRHIRDADVELLRRKIQLPLNLEIAATSEMVDIACRIRPHAVCIVPERRAELTTEGGLDLAMVDRDFPNFVERLRDAGIRVSVFADANISQISRAIDFGIPVVEIHTGQYCHADGDLGANLLKQIADAAEYASHRGIECHAGHGLNYENVASIAKIAEIVELNIGHFLVGEALFIGFSQSIRHMRFLMDQARAGGGGQ